MRITVRRVVLLAGLAGLAGLALPFGGAIPSAHEARAVHAAASMHEPIAADSPPPLGNAYVPAAIEPTACHDDQQPCSSHSSCRSRTGCSAAMAAACRLVSRATTAARDGIGALVLTPPGAWRGAPRSPPPRRVAAPRLTRAPSAFREAASIG